MKNLLMKNFSILFCSISLLIVYEGCDNSVTFQPKGDYISGYAVFADTNFMSGNGFYAIALYSCQGSPMTSIPYKTDSINMNGLSNPYYWRIECKDNGNYYLAVVWKESISANEIPMVLGTYGCDTTHFCHEHKAIGFPNFTGANYNILCWPDSTRKLN